ncbi:hypothetical protein [Clostridioides sp. ZZV15-6388]|uniref:hypothetical protein n=1 Tax=unclassified Clostridioides TaxID=2635829 RepID=UPI001D11C6B4|nr:hypothetical protein [Clostridioides sp. ZZV15-6388]MCC0663571.1 hypothetical protein [Clostridioides sp. ZZV15-6597]
MKKSEIFIFVSIIILCFVIFPNKVFGQEETCLEDFKRWVQENKNNKEEIVYTLSCDMVIDEEFRFYIPYDSNFTIDTNKYKILIKNHGKFIIDDNELNIIGEGGKEGVIHVENGGSISIGINNIIATDGTALYVEEGGDLYLASSYEYVEKIKANGKNAIGIYTENDIRIPNKDIEVNGESAIGVYSKGDVEIEESSIKVYSSNKENGLLRDNNELVQSIVSESKKIYIIGSYNELIPAISEDSGYNIVKCCHRGIGVFSEEIKVSKDDKIENIKFSKDMVLETSSSNQIDIDVEWDFTDYYEKLKKEENFSITGKFKTETLNKEKIIINDDVVPILNISVVEKKPIDNLELEFQNTRNGYVAALYYDMPYSASKVFVEYSSDGINWISEEQEDIREQAILFFEDFKLRCFRVRVEGGLKEGYSNIVFKPGFIVGGGDNQETPDDERENDDIDGDRGGGGRDDPDREDSEIIGDTNDNNESEATDEQIPEDSNKVTESNDEEKDNKPQKDENNDNSDEKNINTENETDKNINNQDKNFKSNDLIMKNKIENSLKEILTENHNENDESSKSTFNDKNTLNRQDTSEVGKFNDKLDSPSQSQNKTQNFNSGIIIGIGIVVSTMLCSITAVNPGIIKYINKFIKFK